MRRLVLPVLAAMILLVVAATGLLAWRHANEARAAEFLRHAVFAALVQFQAGAYRDPDQDSVGGYGHLGQLTGQHATDKIGAGSLHLLSRDLDCPGPDALAIPRGVPQVSAPLLGYRFASFSAYGPDLPMVDAWLTPTADVWWDLIDDGERGFLVVAWPERYGLTGRLSFALAGDGSLLAADLAGADSAEAVARAFFGSAEAALRGGAPRPGLAMPADALAVFTGSRLASWIASLRGRLPF